MSGFVDTPPYLLPDGTSADLTAMTNNLQDDSDLLYGVTTPNRPVWQLYAHGPLASLLPASMVGANAWVAVWVGDDPGETDNDPSLDGNAPCYCMPSRMARGAAGRWSRPRRCAGPRPVSSAAMSRSGDRTS